MICCRSMRYSVWQFDATAPSSVADTGVVVRLVADTLRADCDRDAALDVLIANNTDDDIYIPFSKELAGSSLKLYPWRVIYADGRAVRLARQLQFNDLVEREDALARFFRLPSGRQVVLHGVVPQRWLCSPTTPVTDEYLGYELDPLFYSDRTRSLRAREYRRDPDLLTTVPLAFEIAYTTLGFIDALPVKSRARNSAGDTTQIGIAVKEEPATFLNGSQHVARSNSIVLHLR